MDEFQEILKRYEKAERSGKSAYFDADDLLDIIDWYMEEERDADADKAIRFARHLHPSNADIDLAEARLRIYQGDYDAAAKIMNDFELTDDPEVSLLASDLLLHRANTCQDVTYREPLIELSEKAYEHTILLADNDPGFFSSVISQHSREELFDKANRWIDRAFALHPDHPAILDAAALCYALQGRAREAIDLANKLIDLDPYNARSWGILGDIYHDFGDYTQALEAYDYVKVIRPDEMLSEQNMADCHFALGHYAEANRLYHSAMANYSDSTITPPPAIDTDFIRSKIELCKMHLKNKKE